MLLRLFSLFTASFGLLVPAMAGWFSVPYAGVRQYISELGALGAPNAALINFGVFLPTGLLALVTVLWLATKAPRHLRLPVLLLLGLAVGNVGAALIPCDPGCPAEGSPRQAVHNLLGLVQYLSGSVGLVWLGRRAGQPGLVVAGLAVFACLYLMGGPGAAWRGLWQRVAELMLYGALPFLAWQSTRSTSSQSTQAATDPACARDR